MKTQDSDIIVEQSFDCSSGDLWNAITDHKEMIKWYFSQIPDFRPEIGFKTEFVVENEGRVFTHQWEIVDLQHGSLISYSWRFKEYEGLSLSEFHVSQNQSKADLKLVVKVLEDFPDGIPEFKRESCIGGWNYFLKGNLKDYLQTSEQA